MYQSKLQDENMDYLFQCVLQLQTVEECYRFFEDLCTFSELKAFAQRLQVAKLLQKKTVYTEIVGSTGASTATISRVNRALNYGNDGYKLIMERLQD